MHHQVATFLTARTIWPLSRGLKTQHREPLTPFNTTIDGYPWPRGTADHFRDLDWHTAVPARGPALSVLDRKQQAVRKIEPLVEVGARLWVRQAWSVPACMDALSSPEVEALCMYGGADHLMPPVRYADADDGPDYAAAPGLRGRWRDPWEMPRVASRMTVAITEVRFQRPADVTEAEMTAEGVFPAGEGLRQYYEDWWETSYGYGKWRDPGTWVLALAFDVELRNIDAERR